MLFIPYVIGSVFIVWNVDAQRAQNPFGYDFNSLLFGAINDYSQGGGGNDYSEPINAFSGASSNTQISSANNKINARASQQPITQSQIFAQKSKSQQQSFQTRSQYSQNSFKQSQQQSFQTAQTQQQSYQQNGQQSEQSYQQNTQPQQQYNQNGQLQQQLYQQKGQQQQQLLQQNGQSQQQLYQQNGQPQQQWNQQKGQPQQQWNQQNGQPQQQSYQQNFAGNNRVSQNPTPNVLSTAYGNDDRTGNPKQNSNYNNATYPITRFGLKMFKAMNRDYQNVVASPYSVAALLALVQQGARGDTEQEITQLLQLTPESSARLFNSMTTFIKKRHSNNVFKVGSNVFLSNEFNVDPQFKSAALNTFGSDVRPMDFKNPYNAAQQINQWVAGQTNQKIQNLLVPEAVQYDTLAMLVNAVYFKGIWDKKFDSKMSTKKEFTLSDGSRKVVPFMETRRLYQVDNDPAIKSQVLLMPFEGTQYTMMFILPYEGVYAAEVLSLLTEQQLYSYQSITSKEVKVEIPKFNIKKDSDLSYVLNLLGLWKIFSPEVDLTGMGRHKGQNGQQSPRISSGLHSAVLSIDEQGSTAAAATVFSVVALSYDDPTATFIANRPFLAILWDKELSMPLFMAKIEDPKP